MITAWEPLTGRVVAVPEWDARGTWLRYQDAAQVPLTLAVKEALRGAPVRFQDTPGGAWWCGDCLADLPAGRAAQDAHDCQRDRPELGDLVWYSGAVPRGYGRLYQVTAAWPGRVRLWDMGNVLDVTPGPLVSVIRKQGAAPQ